MKEVTISFPSLAIRKIALILFGGVIALTPLSSSAALGEEWTLATDDPGWTRIYFSTITFNDKMWVMGGFDENDVILNDVQHSEDGVTWTVATANAEWDPRLGYGLTVFEDKLWIMGGFTEIERVNDVWSSPDGITWTEATSTAEWSGRTDLSVAAFNNKLWVMGGSGGAEGSNDVWSSSDGITWTEETDNAAWSGRYAATALVFDDRLWILGGYADAPTNDVWYTDDGVTWTEATASAEWEPRSGHGAAVLDDKLWIMGGSDEIGTALNDVWYSSDGITWTEATSTAEWPARTAFGSTAFDNSLWVMGGGQTSLTGTGDVWFSSLPTYDLTFDEQGGTSVSDIADQGEGDSVTLPAAPTRSGFTFTGWNTAANGSGTNYAAGAPYTMPDSDTTLYAIWSAEVVEEEEEEESSRESTSRRRAYCTETRTTFCAKPPSSVTESGDDAPAALAERDLYFGMSGDDVKKLQELLISQGYAIPAGPTGLFYTQTRAALAAYQAAHGISPAAGYFGPITRAYMKSVGLSVWW